MTSPVLTRERLRAVRDFWFLPPDHPNHGAMRDNWFSKVPAFDEEIRRLFLGDTLAAAAGAFVGLDVTAEGTLALLLLTDQFPRNLFRGVAGAFTADPIARRLAAEGIDAGFDRALSPVQRLFYYLPFEHSELLADQERSLSLYGSLPTTSWRDQAIDAAERHHAVVARFGRFPHRNIALGRPSTPEEIEFLKQPGSSF
ncbi:MAG: DUF924 domain-containing protein [Proteobacteria bacterium]|nr:DUF924 domain-containing protein [Pseudomonadota bacterium]